MIGIFQRQRSGRGDHGAGRGADERPASTPSLVGTMSYGKGPFRFLTAPVRLSPLLPPRHHCRHKVTDIATGVVRLEAATTSLNSKWDQLGGKTKPWPSVRDDEAYAEPAAG